MANEKFVNIVPVDALLLKTSAIMTWSTCSSVFEKHGRGQAEHIYDKTHYDEKHTSLIWSKVIEQSRLTALFSGQLDMSVSITMAYTLNCRKY